MNAPNTNSLSQEPDILGEIGRKFHRWNSRNMTPATRIYLGRENFMAFKNQLTQRYFSNQHDIADPITYCDCEVYVVSNDPNHLEIA